MRKADAIIALITLLVGIVVICDALRLGVFGWTILGPEPGLYIFVLAVCMSVGSLVVLGQVFVRSRKGVPDEPFLRLGGLRPLLYVAVPALIMVLLTEFIGLYLAASLYIGVYMRWIGKYSWVIVLAVSISVPLVIYFVFERGLLIPLPQGMLGDFFRF